MTLTVYSIVVDKQNSCFFFSEEILQLCFLFVLFFKAEGRALLVMQCCVCASGQWREHLNCNKFFILIFALLNLEEPVLTGDSVLA